MITTLALDLEGTLISNAMSQIPRPGLHAFLDRCYTLCGRVVIYTAISESRFREIAALLVRENLAPAWFAGIEYVHWDGDTKDLSRISGVLPENALLVDDLAEYVHPGQEGQWVPVTHFASPYSESDVELCRVLVKIEARLDEP